MTRVTRRIQRKGVYQTSTHLAAVVLLVVVFVMAGSVMMLGLPGSGDDRERLLDELAAARATWSAKRPAAFRYVVQRSCDCPAEDTARYVVTERPGSRGAEYPVPVESEDGEFLTSPPRPVWLGELFPLAEQALRDGAEVTVQYDAVFSYPRLVSIGGATMDSVTIRDFEVLRD